VERWLCTGTFVCLHVSLFIYTTTINKHLSTYSLIRIHTHIQTFIQLLIRIYTYTYTLTHTHLQAELELRRPLFCGKTELEQLELIFRTLGTPTTNIWPTLSEQPYFDRLFHKVPQYPNIPDLNSPYRRQISSDALGLLDRLLVMDPLKRISAHAALNSKYFMTKPYAPSDPSDLPKLDLAPGTNLHEYATKQQVSKS